jgi:hypothetical protein
MPSLDSVFRVLVWSFVTVAGVACVFLGILEQKRISSFLARAVRTHSAVCRCLEDSFSTDESLAILYTPVVQYEIHGNICENTAYSLTSTSPYMVGQVIDILYDPDRPDEPQPGKPPRDGAILLAFGLLFVTLGTTALCH